MPVSTQHPDYEKSAGRWALIRSIVDNRARDYIRTPDKDDPIRTKQYKDDAILTNFTNLTLVGLVGLVFRKDLYADLPAGIEYMYENSTGSGLDIDQLSQFAISELLQTGRLGLLVDYVENGQVAYIKPYSAENIINWKTKNVNGQTVASLVVLLEHVLDDQDDVFSQATKKQYRVLYLNDVNEYVQIVYNEDGEIVSSIVPKDFNGLSFGYIPFVFAGSVNNDPDVDHEPLYDLAVVNLGHYRNSADYEESIFICGQPFPVVVVGEASQEEFMSANPAGFMFGSRKGLVLAGGGNASLLQANPNQLVAEAMKEKLAQAAAIGARLISPAGGRETAEAAKIRYGSQHSALYTIVKNVESALEKALVYVCAFMGVDGMQVEFELNEQFYEESADPNLIAQQLMMLDKGVVSVSEIREYGVKTGFLKELEKQEDGIEVIQTETEVINPED